MRVIKRVARRQGAEAPTDTTGILFLEIDGLALPILQQAMRDGSAPNMARWVADGGYRLAEWEPDLSSQTGASQAGILLGSNENIPAFRWVEKETGRLIACSAPADCAEIERRHATGVRLARQRGGEPWQPAVGRGRRGDPDRQPHRGREESEPRLPRVLRERVQRHAGAGAVFLGGGPGVDGSNPRGQPGRAPARPPRRDLSPYAGRHVRDRAGPGRIRRPHGHDAWTSGDLRDVRELRRGRASLRAPARRHDGGPAQARPAVRQHRTGAAVRAQALRDRRALRPWPDSGRDVQAAKRLRPRRSGGAVACPWRGRRSHGRRRAGRDGRPRRRGKRPGAERTSRRRTTSRAATSWCSAPAIWG